MRGWMCDDKIGERFDGLDKGEAHGSGGAKPPALSLINSASPISPR